MHDIYMQRALDLALLGQGNVSPNPLVGCVLVANNQVIGEGWHKQYGQAHAEVNAVADVTQPALLQHATAYVSLEPCSHFGKTPPCADLLIRSKIKHLVVCNLDPNTLVAGKGLQRIKEAGIEITTGILEREGRELNKRFFTFIEKKRPYIILKWAQTADGFVARSNYDSKWISNHLSRKWVHKWRTTEDAILVGTQTALHDNPRLNARDWEGRQPTRVVLDLQNRLPHHLHLFDGSQRTIVICEKVPKTVLSTCEYWPTNTARVSAMQLMELLYKANIQSIIVEGGSMLLNMLIAENCWDEALVFTSPQCFTEGIKAPFLQYKPTYVESIAQNLFSAYRNLF